MTQVLYSINSHRKIVHLSNCEIIHRVPKKNRRTFDSLEEAFEHGYHICKCCPAIAQRYRREKKAVDSFCRNNQLQFKIEDGAMHVISPHECWRIITCGKKRKLTLYHKNKFEPKGENIPSIIPGYHYQAYHSDTILEYLEYIVRHDEFRSMHPCAKSSRITKIKQQPYSTPWIIGKYGEPWHSPNTKGSYVRIKGTKRYREEQKKKKRRERRESIVRVNELIEELAAKREYNPEKDEP